MLWVIPCQTTGKKLEPQKNGILIFISITNIQNCEIRSFISVVLELVCHFGQILSFDIFLTNTFLFSSKKNLLPILFDQWPKIDPFLKFLPIFRIKYILKCKDRAKKIFGMNYMLYQYSCRTTHHRKLNVSNISAVTGPILTKL